MKKQGFTLIELLAVIVVLGVIAVLTVPLIGDSVSESKEKAYASQIGILKQAAQKYMKDNIDKLPNDSCCVKIDTLIREDYISATNKDKNGNYIVLNPKTKEPLTGSIKVQYNGNYNQYEYSYSESCTNYCQN